MKTGPLSIVKHSRGKYQVLNCDKRPMHREYISLWDARHIVIEHKLQDKALGHPGVLKAAECMTGYTGESLINWLYQVLIRLDITEMRLIIKKPGQLKPVHDAFISRIEKSLKQ